MKAEGQNQGLSAERAVAIAPGTGFREPGAGQGPGSAPVRASAGGGRHAHLGPSRCRAGIRDSTVSLWPGDLGCLTYWVKSWGLEGA
jgi:hypothetical protein